jgi:WD40 repeat protein
MVVINSDFQINYLRVTNEGVFNVLTFDQEHTGRINDIAFFKDENSNFDSVLLSASADGTIKLWDARSSKKSVQTIKSLGKAITSIDTNKTTLAAGYGLKVGLWELKYLKNRCIYQGHSDEVTSVKLTTNKLLTTGVDYLINIFDVNESAFSIDEFGLYTVNLNQSLNCGGFLDAECNFIQAITTVYTYHIIDTNKGYSVFEFDTKSVRKFYLYRICFIQNILLTLITMLRIIQLS